MRCEKEKEMMKSRIWLALPMVVGLICSTTLVGSAALAGGTLVFGSSGDAVRLDPADVTDGESIQRMDNIFEGLVEYESGSTEIQPCLATSWETSKDGKEITFHLRKGVKFHDGIDFNADAVVFSLRRQYDKGYLPWHDYGEWAYWGYMFSDVEKVVKIDDYTVKIVLTRINASIMTSLAMFTVCIVSPTNAAKWGPDTFKHPVGTGPFKFVEWVKDDHIALEANDNYWRERPKLDRLIFKVVPDPSARLMALEVGEVQGIEYPDPTHFDRIKANPDLKLLTEPGMNVGYMAMNTGYGNGMPPFMLGYNDDIEDYPYDPQKAKKLLAEGGYPDGFEVTLYVMPVSRPYMFDPPKIGEAIQSYLAAVGITVKFYQVDWGTYLQETEAGNHQMCLLGWTGDNGDPDNFMNVLYGPNACSIGTAGNYGFYNDEEAQDLLSKALQTYDESKRAEYYQKVQEMIHEAAPWVYLAHSNQNVVFRKNVQGYVLHPTSRKFF